MNTYIGTKIIKAKPMNRQEYNNLRGWVVPADENPADEGYLVEYLDGGKANLPGFEGYISWSPKEVFENAYRSTGGMTFGDALVMLEAGKKVANPEAEGRYLQFAQTRKGDPLNRHVDRALYWFSHEQPERPPYPFLATGLLLQSKDWQVVE